MTRDPELEHVARAFDALCDRDRAELRICEAVLKTEADVGRRRVAESRYAELSIRRDRAA